MTAALFGICRGPYEFLRNCKWLYIISYLWINVPLQKTLIAHIFHFQETQVL